jgi:cytochrome c6
MNSLEAITTQVTKGKNAMPAFGAKLKPEQIDDVATYVLEQSEKDWKG